MDFYHRCGAILDALDVKKGSIKGLCMSEAKRSRKEGEAGRFLKVLVGVLSYRPHLLHIIKQTKLLEHEPTLFVAPGATASATTQPGKVRSAAVVSKELAAKSNTKKWQHGQNSKQRPAPTPLSLATVMVHDLMFAKRGLVLAKEHKIRKKLEKYKPAYVVLVPLASTDRPPNPKCADDLDLSPGALRLEKETEREKRRRKVLNSEGLKIALPERVASSIENIGKGKQKEADAELGEDGGIGEVRWLRVNTLKWTVEDAVEWFEEQRWELFEDVDLMLEAARSKSKVLALDAHIEPLLALPASTSLQALEPFRQGQLIAQDKASCMPAWVLLAPILLEQLENAENGIEQVAEHEQDGQGDVTMDDDDGQSRKKRKKGSVKVLDATAAPGNKTTMAAAMLGEAGRVVAVERDLNRFKVLKSMCQKAGASTVTPMNTDFLSIKPDDPKIKNISHILVDPSCSGSGIPSRLDHLVPEEPEEDAKQRIKALSNFQVAILSHALRFVGARRVVYSTCSIWPDEDEGVVMRILAKKEFQKMGWRLAPHDDVLPTWERRGLVEHCGGDENVAQSVVRCLPEDQTNGFFVACFVKDETDVGTEQEPKAHQPNENTMNSTVEAEPADQDVEEWAGINELVVDETTLAEPSKSTQPPKAKAGKSGKNKKAAFLAERARRKTLGQKK
ncbi:hypothetical protein OIV83_002674 [Microbotryomycetes sp. JL201]|nr:hypothetical protein OIV83_002674 [Microbotryomycetes sp. JL201]